MDDFADICRIAAGHHAAGRWAEAVEAYRRAIFLQPNVAAIHNNLGSALRQLDRYDDAAAEYREAIRLQPAAAQAHSNLGNVLKLLGDVDGAIAAHRRAIELQPDNAEAHNNLATALEDAGEMAAAIAEYRRAVELKPASARIHSNLVYAIHFSADDDAAAILAAHREWNERHASYLSTTPCRRTATSSPLGRGGVRAIQQGAHQASAPHPNLLPEGEGTRRHAPVDPTLLERARDVRRHPSQAERIMWNRLRNRQLGGFKFRRQTSTPPFVADFYCDERKLIIEIDGNRHGDRRDYDASRTKHLLRDGLRVIRFVNEDVFNHLDAVLEEILRTCEGLSNESPPLLLPPGEGADEGRGQRAHLAGSTSPNLSRRECDRTAAARRARVGYISPDFCDHAIGRFMLPLLANHDRSRFEIFCYSDVLRPDAMTDRLRSHADHWRILNGLCDDAAAELIAQDRLDLLIDLTMHMQGNRLPVLARRPAPVQATYLAYCSTTGLDAIDYRFTDRYLDQEAYCFSSRETAGMRAAQQDAQLADRPHLTSPGGRGTNASPYSECSVYLKSYWCYQPPESTPDIAPLPAARNGFITFGCLNSFCKVSPVALSTWSRLLAAVPDSKLILHSKAGSHRYRVLDVFARANVDPSRISFVGLQPLHDYFATYNQIDIALDPFPYGGGTTSLDGIWMGVPLVTLEGQTAVGRGGVSILSHLGLTDLIAKTTDQYLDIASRLAQDISRLIDLRTSLRGRSLDSSLMDQNAFARDIESAFDHMIAGHCINT